jgi:hypothetical protein
VKAVPERDQVVAVPELAQEVVVVPARGHPRAQLAVALRIKSVTAAHRRGLQLRPAGDLAAVEAETTRGPAATEAVIAWVVVDLVAAEAAVAAVAVAGVVAAAATAEDGDKQTR